MYGHWNRTSIGLAIALSEFEGHFFVTSNKTRRSVFLHLRSFLCSLWNTRRVSVTDALVLASYVECVIILSFV